MFKILDGRDSFYQWDVDQRLIVADETIKEVHFCNKTDNCSLVVEVYTEDGKRLVNVPNLLLQTDWNIHVYGYTGNYTKHSDCFRVIARTKPANYVYTETEVLLWEQLEEELRADVEAVKADIEADNKAIRAEVAEVTTTLTNVSNAVQGTASGRGAIALKDVSPLQKTVKLNVSRVNLMPSPFAKLDFLENGKNYTFSVALKEGVELPKDAHYFLGYYNDAGEFQNLAYIGEAGDVISNTYSFTAGEDGCYGYHIDCGNLTADMFEYCQLEEGIVATEPTPYIEDLNDVTFYEYGKNLCDMTKIAARDVDTIEVIDKDTIKWNGSFLFNIPVSIPAGTTFTWSHGDIEIEEGECNGLYSWFMIYEDGTTSAQHWKVYTSTAEKDIKAIRIYKSPTDQATITIHDIQIEISDTKTEYETYKEPVEIMDINNIPVGENMTIMSDTTGVNIETTYNKDLNKVIADLTAAIISLGGKV